MDRLRMVGTHGQASQEGGGLPTAGSNGCCMLFPIWGMFYKRECKTIKSMA